LLDAYYIQGYRTKEIALERGCSEVAVGIRLFRARRAVMRLLRGGALAQRHPLQGP
jgi:DNA-directed RNA polymerase specialized sigma24 family protein